MHNATHPYSCNISEVLILSRHTYIPAMLILLRTWWRAICRHDETCSPARGGRLAWQAFAALMTVLCVTLQYTCSTCRANCPTQNIEILLQNLVEGHLSSRRDMQSGAWRQIGITGFQRHPFLRQGWAGQAGDMLERPICDLCGRCESFSDSLFASACPFRSLAQHVAHSVLPQILFNAAFVCGQAVRSGIVELHGLFILLSIHALLKHEKTIVCKLLSSSKLPATEQLCADVWCVVH